MDVLTDDHEREQAVRKWWRENWKPLAIGVAVAIAAIVGYKQYQAWDLERSQVKAFSVYQIQNALTEDAESEEARNNAIRFMKENHDLYGSLVALELSSVQLSSNDSEGALKSLAFAKQNGGDFIKPLATIIEARIFAFKNEFDKALGVLKDVNNEAYKAETYELMGDIYMQKGDRDQAHDAYKNAMDLIRLNGTVLNPLLEMKFNSVIRKEDTTQLVTVDSTAQAVPEQE